MAEFSGSGSIDTDMPSPGATSCGEYKENLTLGLAPYEILNFVTPHNNRVWTERGGAWIITMGIYVGILSLVYLLLGTVSFVLIFKKDCVRLPTKTFFTVYLMLAVLGFTRALHLLLDPYGLFAFISKEFSRWIIISRLFALSGFPSLVACCTLIIFTLLKIPKATLGNQWYHYWRYVIPIAVAPYIIAVIAEVISYLVTYPALISIVICEAFFVLWGITICIAYLFTGVRLLREVRVRMRRTMRSSASMPPNQEDVDRHTRQKQARDNLAAERQSQRERTRKSTRKISIITYTSAIIGIIYSLLTAANLTMVCLLVFYDCLGFNEKQGNSALWLALQAGTRVTEVILAFVIFYSITDVTLVVKFMKQILLCGSCCCRNRQVVQQCGRCNTNSLAHNLQSMHSNNTSEICILTSARQTEDITVDDTTSRVEMEGSNRMQNSDVEASAEVAIEMQPEDTQVVTQNEEAPFSNTGLKNPRVFMLNAQTDSIETGVTPLDSTSLSRTVTEELRTTTSNVATATNTNTNELSSLDTPDLERQTPLLAAGDPVPDRETNSSPSSKQKDSVDERTTGASPVTIVTVGGMSSVATQTVEQRTIACQTESPVSQKPVPKPRRVLPSNSPKPERSRRQRLRDQRQLQNKDTLTFLFRKQTV